MILPHFYNTTAKDSPSFYIKVIHKQHRDIIYKIDAEFTFNVKFITR
jgi:hypothetical protein